MFSVDAETESPMGSPLTKTSSSHVRPMTEAINYESILRDNQRAIAEDPLNDLLLVPDSDVTVVVTSLPLLPLIY